MDFRAILGLGLLLIAWPSVVGSAETQEPNSARMVCGACPSGYAVTGITTAPEICKEGDPTLLQCVPLGSMNLLSVCGACPDGYRQVGSSSVPARCGTAENGRMAQCQLETFEPRGPDPNKGGVFCPPNCAGALPTPGQGALPPTPKYAPPPKEEK